MAVGDQKQNAKFPTSTTRRDDSLRRSIFVGTYTSMTGNLKDRSDSASVESVFGCEIEIRLESSLLRLARRSKSLAALTERPDVSHIVLHHRIQLYRPKISLESARIPIFTRPAPLLEYTELFPYLPDRSKSAVTCDPTRTERSKRRPNLRIGISRRRFSECA